MEKFRIAFVVDTFPTISETFIVNQIADLLKRGHKVEIFAFNSGDHNVLHQNIIDFDLLEKVNFAEVSKDSRFSRFHGFVRYLFQYHKNISFTRLPKGFNFWRYGKKAFNLWHYQRYKWILSQGSYDIIHAHFGHNGAYIAEMKRLGFLSGTRLVTSFHGYDLKPSRLDLYRIQYQELFKEVDMLTVNTPYLLDLLLQLSPKKPIAVLPVGLNTKGFNRGKEKKIGENFNVLFVGRLVELKGPDLAIEVVKILRRKGFQEVRLTIAGAGEMMLELKELIKKSNLRGVVELKGEMSQEDIRTLMESADVFLLPGIHDREARAETQGLVVQEAQAMGIPVIVSDAGGVKYGLIDGETGFVVKAGDIQSFADKIERLIRDKTLLTLMGMKGREYVEKHFDSRILGKRLEEIYYQTLHQRKRK